jgi:hypothetical protein
MVRGDHDVRRRFLLFGYYRGCSQSRVRNVQLGLGLRYLKISTNIREVEGQERKCYAL